MKVIDVFYLAETNKSAVSVLYCAIVLVVIVPMVVVFKSLDGQGDKASALPVPGTYRESASVATVAARAANAKLIADAEIARTASVVVWPLHGKITTQYGAPDLPYQRVHTGIDISTGQPSGVSRVVAFKSGHVFKPSRGFGGYGNIVGIEHGGGLTSYYGHLYSITVAAGQPVKAGDIIGTEGSTGSSTGPHVHFEVRQNDALVNPRTYLAGNP